MGAAARKAKAKPRIVSSKAKRERGGRFQQGTALAVGALIAAVVVCYANSLGNGFVFDDEFLVPAYSRVWGLSHLAKILFESYRPVRNASYVIDFLIWGSRPFGFHLTNLLLHAANSLLVFFLIRRFSVAKGLAFLAALIFAVHPIQTDSVSYISGRRDLLFTLFYLAAFHAYLTYRASGSRKYFLLFLGSWALSLMSKEMAVSLPLVIFVWNFCSLWEGTSDSLFHRALRTAKRAFIQDKWLYTLLAAASMAFGGYLIFFQGASGRVGRTGLDYWGGSLYATLLTVARVHSWYFKQLVFPTPIAQYFGAFEISTSLLDWRVLLSVLIVGVVLVGGVVCLKKNRLIAFAVFSYFAALAPVSQIIPHHELLADHYLYLPMMSFGLLVALIVDAVARRGKMAKQAAYCVAGAGIVAFAALTVTRNRDWKDELSVWQANYRSVPHSPRASYNLGGLYMSRDPNRSEALLKESIANDPTFEPSYLTLAKLYVTQKRTTEAQKLIQQGMGLIDSRTRSFVLRNPSLLKSQFTTTLAAAKWEEGDHEATEQLLREATATYPQNLSAYEALANVYHNQDLRKEEEVLREAVRANPSAYEVRARLAAVTAGTKRYDETITFLREMLALSPSESSCEKARPHLGEVKSRVPNSMEQNALRNTLELVVRQCAPK